MLKGTTDCPLYDSLLTEQSKLLRYLLDVRDCLVHHRSFASSDNSLVLAEGATDARLPELLSPWHEPVTRITFRRVEPGGIAVNILLPDAIFEYGPEGSRKNMVREFKYDERINLLTQAREFAKLVVGSILHALALLSAEREPVFTWRRR